MNKYRPKPFVVEAFQWLGNDSFIPFKGMYKMRPFDEEDKLSVVCQTCGSLMSKHSTTYEFDEHICPNDWILYSVDRTDYPFSLVRANAFEELYELVE